MERPCFRNYTISALAAVLRSAEEPVRPEELFGKAEELVQKEGHPRVARLYYRRALCYLVSRQEVSFTEDMRAYWNYDTAEEVPC